MIDSDGQAAPRAMIKAFSTVETFEAILLKLELRDLLLVQRVNSYFKKVIDESPALQQRLFFSAEATASNRKREPEMNPLLAALFPGLFMLERPVGETNIPLATPIRSSDFMKDPRWREKMLRPEASWRRMFPIQPPTRLEAIRIYSYDSCVHSMTVDQVRAELSSGYQRLQKPGMRMGLLFDLIAYLEGLHPFPMFFVRWKMFPMTDMALLQEDRHADIVRDWDELNEWEKHYDKETGWDYYHYDHLFADPQATGNTIEIYHNHDSLCGYGLGPVLEELHSPYMSAAKETCGTLLDFLDAPNTYATNWRTCGRHASL